MAIDDLGLCTTQTTSRSLGIQLKAGAGSSNVRLMWSTLEGSSTQASFTFTTRWRGIPKGGTGGEDEYYRSWSSPRTVTISAANCNEWQSSNSDRTFWWVPLENVLGSIAIGGSSWSYSGRTYDQIEIDIQDIHSTYNYEIYGSMVSASGWLQYLYVGAYPDLEITDGYLQTNTDGSTSLILKYADSASDWTRIDDRYEILQLRKSSASGTSIVPSGTWGYREGDITKFGWISIPTSSMTSIPSAGDRLYLSIRWNAAYRPSGMSWVAWSGTLTLSDTGSLDTPTGSGTVNADGSSNVSITGSDGATYVEITVSGSSYAFDKVVAEYIDAGSIQLAYPPFDVETVIEFHTTGETGNISSTGTTTIFVPSYGRIQIDLVDSALESLGYDPIKAWLDISWSENFEREQESVKFAGRTRESVAYGEGGSATLDVSFTYQRTNDNFTANDELTPLLKGGLAVIRVPGGRRWLATIEGFSTEESADSGATKVTLSCREVV